ncbi:MAG TPA: TldD/PmbA family protein [Tissierellaceae bacterium]
MRYEELINKILEKAKENLSECEVYLSTNKETSMEVFEGELSKYNIAESGGLSLRGIYNGKMGYAYTEKLDESSIDSLIQGVIDNAEFISGDKEIIYKGDKDYKKIDFTENLLSYSREEKINFIKQLEKEALLKDERLKPMASAYEEIEVERYIVNSKGVNLNEKQTLAVVYLGVMVEEKDEVKTGYSFKFIRDFEKLNKEEIINEAVNDAISSLGAKAVKSDNYPVVFKNTTFGSLLAAFSSVFVAENVQKGLSLLKGKLKEQIANEVLTLVDDPYLKDGLGTSGFDDEGTKTSYKEVIKEGKLQTYLYNWKTAIKDDVESTGNAGRSYKGSVGTSVSNFYILEGDKSKDEILKDANEGLYLTSLQGLHSGLDPVSGDFSLSASGYKIENGLITSPVNQITVSGNFFDLFRNIIEIGNDLEFGTAGGGKIGSPTIYVKELSIAGE